MTNKEIIDGLKMTMELITFDPSTGETIDPDNLNDLNRTTYDACNGAIKALEGEDNVPDTNVGELIGRTDAIELVKDVCDAIMSGCKSHYDSEVGDEVYDDILEVDAILKCNKEIRKALKGMPSAQPEPQTARVFQEIIVEYPSISTYPEHEGKPYFSIKYTEDGKGFIGYGTYKPEVLSEYLKEYFMPTAQSENLVKESGGLVKDLVNDTISRNDAIDAVKRNTFRLTLAEEQNGEGHVVWSAEAVYSDVMKDELLELPPAQPERPKGHWIFDFAHNEMTCSECGLTFTGGFDFDNADNFCRHCGSDNRGEQDDVSR